MDQRPGPAADPVEALRILHLLDLFKPGSLSLAARAVARYGALPTEEREALAIQALYLRDDVQERVPSPIPEVLLELACLATELRQRPGKEGLRTARRDRPLSTVEVQMAASWLESASEILSVYHGLSPDQREAVLSYGAEALAGTPQTPDDPGGIILALDAVVGRLPRDVRHGRVALYRQLTATEAGRLAVSALEVRDASFPGASEVAESILLHLACLVPGA